MNAKTLYSDDYRAIQRRRHKRAVQRKRSLESTRMVVVCSRIFYIIGILCISLAIATCASCIIMKQYYHSELQEQQKEITNLELENQSLLEQINTFSNTYNETASLLENVSEMAYKLDQENDTLVTQLNELQKTINSYEEREELFDKYEWAIIRSNDTHTDITYERITSLEELAGEKGLSDDSVNLVLALAMTESQGNEDAANPKSTARGLGQMLEATARFTYETLMDNGKGTYNHNMAFDGDINIAMMCYYLDYLGIKYDDNMTLVIKEYRGENDPEYNNKVNSYLAQAGTSLHSIVMHP